MGGDRRGGDRLIALVIAATADMGIAMTGANRAFHRLILIPALLALAMRIAIAPGLMPAADEDGWLTVRVCDAGTVMPHTIRIAIERDAPAGSDADASDHCPFGALAQAPLPPSPAVLPARILAPTFPALAPLRLGFAPGIASPLPPSTGPPPAA
ncbi:MAG: hypothetical protein GW859_01440 [Sphingomonadales bacterium]|nr:hypothetical protein [Sphingomonadales bacterium]